MKRVEDLLQGSVQMFNIYRLCFIGLAGMILQAAPDQAPASATSTQNKAGSAPVTYSSLPKTPQTLTSALWRVDHGFTSVIQLKNIRTADSIVVTPILYMADGKSYQLPAVPLAASESKTINVNQALAAAPAKIAADVSSFGSAALSYVGNIGAVNAAMTMVNPTASLSYTWQMQFSMSGTASVQTLEGLWWRHDEGVDGFVAISNSTSQEKEVMLQMITEESRQLPAQSLRVAAYSTQMLQLETISDDPMNKKRTGGIRIQFEGQLGDINVAGGLANWDEGYSAAMPFWTTMESMPKKSAMGSMAMANSTPAAAPVALSNAGLMLGSPDPMMNFPAGTIFTPYLAVRNTTSRPIALSLAVYLPTGQSLSAPAEVLSPYQAEQLDMKKVLKSMGLERASGTIDLVVSYSGQIADIIEAAGSVDQSGTYVFEVPARTAETSLSKEVPYWSTANGSDTMVTVWNSSSTAEDVTLTLRFLGGAGHYVIPVHLEPYASSNFDVMELIMSQQPDSDGNLIPAGATEGGMTLANAKGPNLPITANMTVGIFDVATATCYYSCIGCDGYYQTYLSPNSLSIQVGTQSQITDYGEMNTGAIYGVGASWSSTNSSIVSIDGSGNAAGNAIGSVDIAAGAYLAPETEVCAYNPSCYSVGDENFEATGTASVNCNFPTGETTQFYQWGDNDPSAGYSPAIAEFYQTLTPTANYSGLTTITEGNASTATDSCWFNGAIQSYGPPVQYASPVYGDSGSSWTVSGAAWGNDLVGLGYTLFASYQTSLPQRGLTSCGITMFQTLTAACSNGTTQPFDGTVVLNILVTGGGVSITREGVNAARNLIGQ